MYKNETFDLDQSVPLWNASVRRIIGKKNKFEMRLAAFDIFNKNVNINQYAAQNFSKTSKQIPWPAILCVKCYVQHERI
ncbi:MAG: hypothetical protein U0Z17_10380 [Bacteroidales bacterium]